MHRFSALVAAGLCLATQAPAMTDVERKELFDQVEFMCRFSENVGEVLRVSGDLSTGASIKLVRGKLSGTVDRTTWANINQLYGDYRNDPTICRQEMLPVLVPLFGGVAPTKSSLSSQAGTSSATASSANTNGAFAVFAGPNGASAAKATAAGTDTSHSD